MVPGGRDLRHRRAREVLLPPALEKRFQAILEDLDRSKLKAQTPHYAELYPMLIAPALMLTLLEILLSLTRFRRFP